MPFLATSPGAYEPISLALKSFFGTNDEIVLFHGIEHFRKIL